MTRPAEYWRNIAVVGPDWRDDENPRQIKVPGRDIDDPGPRLGRTLANHRDGRSLVPNPEDNPTAWIYDDDTLGMRLHQMRDYAVRVGAFADPVSRAEREQAEKFCLQRGGALGWDVMKDGLERKGGDALAKSIARAGRYLYGDQPCTPEWGPYPRDTNSTWPTHGVGLVDKIVHASIAADPDPVGLARAVAGRLEGLDFPYATLFSRQGPNRKWTEFIDTRDGAVTLGEGRGLCPRRRHVFGVPAFLNMQLQGWMNALKTRLRAKSCAWHPSRRYILDRLRWLLLKAEEPMLVIANDPSGFDQHVTGPHLAALHALWGRLLPKAVVDVWETVTALPVIGPPIHPGSRAFAYGRGSGGTMTSGSIFTTIDDTTINLGRVVYAGSRALGVSEDGWIQRMEDGRIGVFVWGDDTLLVVPLRGFSVDAFEAASEEVGFPGSSQIGVPVFLMTYLDARRGTYFPLAARVLQNSMAPEKGPATNAIARLALYMRSLGLDRNPWGPRAWQMLRQDCSLLANIQDRWALQEAVRRDAASGELEADLRARPDLLRQLLERGHRFDPISEEVGDWLAKLFGLRVGEVDIGSVPKLSRDEILATATWWGKGREGDTPSWLKHVEEAA